MVRVCLCPMRSRLFLAPLDELDELIGTWQFSDSPTIKGWEQYGDDEGIYFTVEHDKGHTDFRGIGVHNYGGTEVVIVYVRESLIDAYCVYMQNTGGWTPDNSNTRNALAYTLSYNQKITITGFDRSKLLPMAKRSIVNWLKANATKLS